MHLHGKLVRNWCVTGQTYCRATGPTRQVIQTSKPDEHHAHLALNYAIVRSNKIMVDNSDCVVRHIEVQNRQTDPNWQIANEIYRVENVLKEVYEDYECQSVSKVTPFTYTDSEGNTIVH